MNTKTMKAIALTGALAIVGCVSVDATRTQLASTNPLEVQKAEQNIFVIATTGKDASGFMEFDKRQQIEYVNLSSNNELLLKIAEKAYQDDVVVAAANKIDFTKPGIGIVILTKHKDLIRKVGRAEPNGGEDGATREKKARRDGGAKGGATNLRTPTCFADKVFASLKEDELKAALNSNDVDYSLKNDIARRLIAITEDPQLLISLFDGDMRDRVNNDDRETIIVKLAGLSDKISDSKVIIKTLKAVESHSLRNYIKDPDKRLKLLSRLSEDDAVKYALDEVDHHSVYSWNKDEMLPMDDAVAVLGTTKDPKSAVKIVSAILAKIASYQKACKESVAMSWGREDTDKANALIKQFPKFDDATIVALICTDTTSWTYFIDSVSADVAYGVLSGGKAKSCDLELALVKKLPKEKVDAAIYAGARFAKTRKAIYNSMTAEMKKSTDAAREKAYKAIVEKAKAAEKETFALEGFYLGMTFDDMLVVFDYHFPNIEINEAFDGDKAEADYVIYVEGQSSPFCYATRKDKKVFQFNFGKKLLKKWYQYDVQTPMEWAHAYARDNKIDMKFKLIDKDTTVYEMDMSRSYHVWFHQESYQYKHNAKEYRLTYFGEEKDFTFEGGIGGAVIKGLAAPKFRYVRGDQGSLRARIEKD